MVSLCKAVHFALNNVVIRNGSQMDNHWLFQCFCIGMITIYDNIKNNSYHVFTITVIRREIYKIGYDPLILTAL